MKKFFVYLGIMAAVVVAVPTIALGSSFTISLIQGKTPAEAVTVIAEQVDRLFGRVVVLEGQQETLNDRVTSLEAQNPVTDPALDGMNLPPPVVEVYSYYTLDLETADMCEKAKAEPTPEGRTILGDIQILCNKVVNEKFVSQEHFDETVNNIREKWNLYDLTVNNRSKPRYEE